MISSSIRKFAPRSGGKRAAWEVINSTDEKIGGVQKLSNYSVVLIKTQCKNFARETSF